MKHDVGVVQYRTILFWAVVGLELVLELLLR
jgi:hypothetical protein